MILISRKEKYVSFQEGNTLQFVLTDSIFIWRFFVKKKHLLGEILTATPQHQRGGVFWWLLFFVKMPCCRLASVRAAMGKSPNDSPGANGLVYLPARNRL